jgi:transposase
MDSPCIETVLDLPEFRVFNFELRDSALYLHLERRERFIVCPRCQRVCQRTKESSRTRCSRDLPLLEHPVVLGLHMRRFECKPCQ